MPRPWSLPTTPDYDGWIDRYCRHDHSYRAWLATDHSVVHLRGGSDHVVTHRVLLAGGVYLIKDSEVTSAANNFRFNESSLDVLR